MENFAFQKLQNSKKINIEFVLNSENPKMALSSTLKLPQHKYMKHQQKCNFELPRLKTMKQMKKFHSSTLFSQFTILEISRKYSTLFFDQFRTSKMTRKILHQFFLNSEERKWQEKFNFNFSLIRKLENDSEGNRQKFIIF